ncbi:methyltransferase domain-containing protein [Saccharothrix sp. 6-C]|uniref:class I SAM-dependent methyltransferase n=1 Tax=Saccharothrix sp. 6-C TaxID=2781735 RepID=UPI001916F51F|nr:class I SAM-dependent methyltransferase [Saccharothrix sp. 6-C]QQQ75334.1 methyltransferase domain-containing protein [Saccharothrix sp. 6-C]
MTVEPLPLTGERTVPGIAEENYWFRRHEAAYLDLVRHCVGAVVLEAGCGEGYGAALIAGHAARVVALDYDELTAAHAHRAYPELAVLRGNLATLPLRDASVDVVVNLQVIEHLWDQEGFLAECARVLRPGGRLLVTTPNRITFSPGRDTPLNPFHTRELAPAELRELLAGAGLRVELLAGLRHGPALRALDGRFGGSIIDAQVAVVVDGGTWPDDLLAAVSSVRAEDFEITTDDLDASLDLVAVAVRP